MADKFPYTTGNWSVSRQTTDTTTTTHNYALPSMNWKADFVKREDEPNEAILVNKTASTLDPRESVRFGYTDVDDVYKRVSGLKVSASEKAAAPTGVQMLTEVKHIYHATNSVNGAELALPALCRITVVVPTHCAVTNDMIDDIVSRGVAAAFEAANDTVPTRIENCAKGNLVPTLTSES